MLQPEFVALLITAGVTFNNYRPLKLGLVTILNF